MLLSICVPTYNRAARLDRQLAWLCRELEGRAADCEVIISDNCSPDATTDVAARWRERIDAPVHVRRAARNVGPLPNIAYCLSAARGAFVWVIGDDDEIAPGTVGFVLDAIRADPELAGIALEFVTVGARPLGPCFGFTETRTVSGFTYVRQALDRHAWGLGFTTSQVYRSEFARSALLSWPDGTRNLDYQVYVTAFVASCGRVLVTAEPRVEYVTGDNYYETNREAAAQLVGDKAEALARIARLGYDRTVCARGIAGLRHGLVEDLWERLTSYPGVTFGSTVRFCAAAAAVVLMTDTGLAAAQL